MKNQVLVVDDDIAITEGLTALFSLESIQASGAYDRETAEAMVAAEFFPVILADLRLKTEADGLALIREIRRISPDSRIATLTGYATAQLEKEILALGSSMVLRKPMDLDEIIRIVSEMLAEIESFPAVQAAARGEESLDLEKLYAEIRPVLYAIPQRRYGFTSEETDELVQNVWMLFLRKRESVESFRPWMAGTIVNLCKQEIQRKTRQREVSREMTEEDEEMLYAEEPSHLDVMSVRDALASVDERTRALCTLIGMEGWSYEEVSQKLGLPIGSIGPLYIRAKSRMRDLISSN